MRLMRQFLVTVFLIVPLFGCAFGTDYVRVNPYIAETPRDKPGSGEAVYVARAVDARPERDLVGHKRNTYGTRTGQIALESGLDLSTIVTTSVTGCLDAYGYASRQAGELDKANAGQDKVNKVLHTKITEFWTDFSPGFFTVDANANMEVEFELRAKDTDRVLWKKTISRKGKDSSAFGATPGLFEESLNRVLRAVMEVFQQDISSPDFRNAVYGNAGGES